MENVMEFLQDKEVILVEQDGVQGLINFKDEFDELTGMSIESFRDNSKLYRSNNIHIWVDMNYILALDVETGNYELFRNE